MVLQHNEWQAECRCEEESPAFANRANTWGQHLSNTRRESAVQSAAGSQNPGERRKKIQQLSAKETQPQLSGTLHELLQLSGPFWLIQQYFWPLFSAYFSLLTLFLTDKDRAKLFLFCEGWGAEMNRRPSVCSQRSTREDFLILLLYLTNLDGFTA